MLKKTGAIAAVAAVATLVLSGCSGSMAGESGGTTNLSVMIWDANQQAGVQNAIDGFTAAHPGYNVTLELVPDDQYYTKLDASLGAQSGPDVMWQSSKVTDYVEGGALEPLDEYIVQSNLDIEQFDETITSLYNFDGVQYGIPKDMDTWLFLYNAETFRELGIEEPTDDWTWDDMLDVAEEIKEKSGDSETAVYYNSSMWNGIATLVEQLGGHVVSEDGPTATLDSPEGREAFEMIMDLVDRGLAPDLSEQADFDPLTALMSGNLAMSAVPSWHVSAVAQADGEFNAVRFPSVNGSYVTDSNGLSYVMNAYSKNKEGAWELIEYLTSVEGAEKHAEAGGALPAIPEAQGAWIGANNAIGNIEVVENAAENIFLRPSTAYPAAREGVDKANNTVIPQIWSKQISIDDGVKQINDLIQAALQ
ncbi:MAG: ABC transporter substrate-binding protein [Gulosibacter sp.]|uniref:ABC transporter substrate-binding protein n=1 Tax=Gulosibacter sp. TaxID=2817531 RepID=UPI003F90D7E4